jgi:hypothetical protein
VITLTVQDILFDVMELCSQIDNAGAIKTDTTAQGYTARIPSIANKGQNELIQFLKFKKTDRQTLLKISGVGFRIVTKAADCGVVVSIMDKCGRNWIDETSFMYEYNGNLYITNDYEGEIIITYIPTPTRISALTDVFTLYDMAINPCLVNYIAYNLVKTSDSTTANLYLQKYEEQRNTLKRLKTGGTLKIINVY